MRLGPYELLPETFQALALNIADSFRTATLGWPRMEGTPAQMARDTLKQNAREVLWAGSGHFHFMWVADFGKTLRGAWNVLGAEYLGGLIDRMTDASSVLGYVPSCFSAKRGFDMPWPRGDGLPWLIYAHQLRQESTGKATDEKQRRVLQKLLDHFEATHFENGLIASHITGDWMDTIRRPSSTYNNLCALMMLRAAPALGLQSRQDPSRMEEKLLEERWKGTYFLDAHETDSPSIDGAVLALYLRLGPDSIRKSLANWLESSGVLDPFPMRCSIGHDAAQIPLLTRLAGGYHRSFWPHLGLMALNGLKRQGRNVENRRQAIENLILRHKQIPEAVDEQGRLYRSLFLSCERGLSMAAGQLLELEGRG